ncbi:hypothetical protein [Rubritalea profundi]|uniref:Uncharacterized protein n=1 Tax=Rubritalea profundi TaxID=1658618 RepID=A0A2S7TZK6_9BACT|nr:hypothetical protein [Rubritalea profundi]PQJ27383.1 hypothetical protein BSZ32_01975 [Rubritalea profundi]
MNKIATGILALIAGVTIGWFAMPTGETSVSSDKPVASQVLSKLVEAGEIIDAEQRSRAVRAAFADAKAAEMKTLAAPVMQLAERRPDMSIRKEFLSRWGELAPRKALAYLGAESLLRDRTPVLTGWGRTDPDGAAESFSPSEKELSDNSHAEARALLAGIAEADPVKALLFADRFALADLTRWEPKPSIFPSNPSYEPSGSYQRSIDTWIPHDPTGAFEVMIALKSSRVREQALNELFTEWPYRDPEASQAAAIRLWERAQLDGDSSVPFHSLKLVETLAQNYGELKGAKAYDQAISLAAPDQRLAALKAALGGWKGWRGQGLPAVADFVAMRLNSDDKTSAESVLLVHAAGWTAGWLTEDGEKDEGIGKAAAWLEKLPAGEARDAAIRSIVSAWSWKPEQQKKLAEWANTLPPSHQRDIAVATSVATISEKEPARAMDMAATIDDPTLRAEALAHVGARFISKEEGGDMAFDVRKWMSQNPKIGKELRENTKTN